MGPLAPDSYGQFLAELKSRIHAAQLRGSLAVNRELVMLYWQIGRDILDWQERQKWGAKVIDRLATDLKRSFPDMKGLSPRNLKYMRAFAEAWPDEPIVQAVLVQITWYHNLAILEKLETSEDRRRTGMCGWMPFGAPNSLSGHIGTNQSRKINKSADSVCGTRLFFKSESGYVQTPAPCYGANVMADATSDARATGLSSVPGWAHDVKTDRLWAERSSSSVQEQRNRSRDR